MLKTDTEETEEKKKKARAKAGSPRPKPPITIPFIKGNAMPRELESALTDSSLLQALLPLQSCCVSCPYLSGSCMRPLAHREWETNRL